MPSENLAERALFGATAPLLKQSQELSRIASQGNVDRILEQIKANNAFELNEMVQDKGIAREGLGKGIIGGPAAKILGVEHRPVEAQGAATALAEAPGTENLSRRAQALAHLDAANLTPTRTTGTPAELAAEATKLPEAQVLARLKSGSGATEVSTADRSENYAIDEVTGKPVGSVRDVTEKSGSKSTVKPTPKDAGLVAGEKLQRTFPGTNKKTGQRGIFYEILTATGTVRYRFEPTEDR